MLDTRLYAQSTNIKFAIEKYIARLSLVDTFMDKPQIST